MNECAWQESSANPNGARDATGVNIHAPLIDSNRAGYHERTEGALRADHVLCILAS